MAANNKENGMVSATISAPRTLPRKQEEDDDDQDDSLGQVVQDGVGGEVQQVASVDEGDNLHALRQNLVVQFLYFLMDAFQHGLCIVALLQHGDARNYIVVIDDSSVLAVIRLAKLAKPDLRSLRNDGYVFDPERRAGLGGNDGVLDVLDVLDQADFANVDLLQSGLDEAAACIGIVSGELLLHLGDAEPVGDQFVGIEAHLIFARGTAERVGVRDTGDGLQVLLYHPGFERLQVHHVVLGVRTLQCVEIDLADRAPVRPHLRHDSRRHVTCESRSSTRSRFSKSVVSSPKTISTVESPKIDHERTWATPGIPFITVSSGMVTCCSICSAEIPGHCAMTST